MTGPALLPRDDFLRVVRDTPLVSLDLLVRSPRGEVLLGWRRNRPAAETWFVPGGVVRKAERLANAFTRVTRAELGVPHEMERARFLGVYEHLYDDNFAAAEGITTHYVVLAWELWLDADSALLPREQHAQYRWCAVADLAADPAIHPNSRAYAAAITASNRAG
jgi:colanic acid biosynthesis protein WcaH